MLRDAIGTVITASPASAEELWLKIKLFDPVEIPRRRMGVETDTASLVMMARSSSTSISHLSKDVNEVLTDLIRVQWRIKQMVPAYLTHLLVRYERHVIRLADVVQTYAILRIAFKPRWIVLMGKSLALLATDRKWVDALSTDLEHFTEFMILHIARWQELCVTEPFRSSEDLQSQLISLFSKVLSYSSHFLRPAGPPLVKTPLWKHRVDGLFEDIKQLAIVLEWTAETIQIRAQVFAAAGLQEETYRPTRVWELVGMVANMLVPEDETRTSRAFVSEVYTQYLATLQFESQQAPSKALVKNINQVAEELDIMLGIVKSQQKVLSQMKAESESPESLNATLQRLEFFHADLEEYKRSCSRLAKLTAQTVELQMEHHNKAIVVFTVVTIVFLPMSFVASVFGMNVADIRQMKSGQWVFWTAALAMTVVVVGFALVIAFAGDEVGRRVKGWFMGRRRGE
ncbi:cora-like Mg2+ transporter protein-domain-containing protein [Trichophaea hybrida]|nr:cora-like Mg2+ transporter protein-domain-containing protein [Trichophaea hybrida]